MDSRVLVIMVNCGSSPNAFIQPFLQEDASLLPLPRWNTYVCHVYQAAN